MFTTFKIMLNSALHDVYLFFWSLIIPLGLLIGLGLYYNNQQYHITLLSGVIGASVIFWAISTTAYHIIGQRNRGVYKLLKITPMKTVAFIIALTSAWSIVSLIAGSIIFIIGIIIFKIEIELGSVLMLYIILVIATLCFMFISFIIANISKNEAQLGIVSNLLVLPMLFLSNSFYSLENAPRWVKLLTRINPFSYLIEGIKSAINANSTGVFRSSLILIIFIVISLTLAVCTFRSETE